jgi:hypothetical protein
MCSIIKVREESETSVRPEKRTWFDSPLKAEIEWLVLQKRGVGQRPMARGSASTT